MQISVIKDIQSVLKEAISAVQAEDYSKLEDLSKNLNHSITVYQDKEAAICSVVVYSLSRVLDKPAAFKHPDYKQFKSDIISNLKFASVSVSTNVNEYNRIMKTTDILVTDFSASLRLYTEPLSKYARSVMAKRMIEHGLSISSAANLFDVPQWDISRQVGMSSSLESISAAPKFNKERVALVKRLFNL